ncbi:MAG TPA: cysteine synthase family protein [Coriobacteriia bacterium]|nr:cysteine synthase family protein [Coriobacteriia bacterium]
MTPHGLLGSDPQRRRYDSLLDMIGDADAPTPLVALTRVAPPSSTLYAKLEWMNPFGSVKDRTARWLLESMERRGELAGKTIVEPTSGNTGIAIAGIARLLGHPAIVVVPHTMPHEKTVLIEALGAQVVRTLPESPMHPMDAAIEIAEQLVAESPELYVMPNQYANLDNPRAHYETTGPEIWAQTGGRIDYLFAGFGTTGTITGAGRYLRERNPDIRIVAIEPVAGHHISGLKNLEETSVPGVLDRSVIDDVVHVDDDETAAMTRRLHAEEVLLAGASSAAVVAGATKWLASNGAEGIGVAVLPDSSQKAIGYLQSVL